METKQLYAEILKAPTKSAYLSGNTTKQRRDAVLILIDHVASTLNPAHDTPEDVPEDLFAALATLYRAHCATKTAIKATPHGWMAATVLRDASDPRHHMRLLHVSTIRDTRYLVGCDGHRLHAGRTSLTGAYYDPATCIPVDETAKYPDVERVVPVHAPSDPLPVPLDRLQVTILPPGNRYGTKGEGILVRPPHLTDPAAIERRYWLEALAGLGDNPTVLITGKHDSVRLDSADGNRLAVIMPVRQPDDPTND